MNRSELVSAALSFESHIRILQKGKGCHNAEDAKLSISSCPVYVSVRGQCSAPSGKVPTDS